MVVPRGKAPGESWKRVAFLLQILQEVPGNGLRYIPAEWDSVCAVPENDRLAEETGYRLYYYSFMRPSFRTFRLDDDTPYRAEVIDTWNMTITDLGIFRGRFDLPLGAKQYMAVRLRRAE